MEPGTHYIRIENLNLNRNSMSKNALGLLIRNLRKAKGLSLRKLAKQVDVSFVNIAHIENGRVVTSKKVLKQLARALNYNLDRLLATGNRVDDDCIKKVATDALTKGLSKLGFNADVFMGRFDDNKYVNTPKNGADSPSTTYSW